VCGSFLPNKNNSFHYLKRHFIFLKLNPIHLAVKRRFNGQRAEIRGAGWSGVCGEAKPPQLMSGCRTAAPRTPPPVATF
jgi:hypothetical protein